MPDTPRETDHGFDHGNLFTELRVKPTKGDKPPHRRGWPAW